MAGNANSGRRRTPIPKGEEAEAELRRLRRQQKRRERAARKRAEAKGEIYVGEEPLPGEDGPPAPVDGPLTPPSVEELKADLMYAFNALGGKAGMVSWGRRYPKEFYQLWAKYCLPKEDSGEAPEGAGLEALLQQLDRRGEALN